MDPGAVQVSSADYWTNRYAQQETGWDIGKVSTPLKTYIDQLTTSQIAVLVPGCGNAYEALYLAEKGFTNVTVIDFAKILTEKIAQVLPPTYTVITGDFFDTQGKFDLVLEQTFFCAIDPARREEYALKVLDLLNPGGKLAGVLFDRSFDNGPPFGGSISSYKELFGKYFTIKTMEPCYNSIMPRQGTELFVILQKKGIE